MSPALSLTPQYNNGTQGRNVRYGSRGTPVTAHTKSIAPRHPKLSLHILIPMNVKEEMRQLIDKLDILVRQDMIRVGCADHSPAIREARDFLRRWAVIECGGCEEVVLKER
jgi:hypothetical protein